MTAYGGGGGRGSGRGRGGGGGRGSSSLRPRFNSTFNTGPTLPAGLAKELGVPTASSTQPASSRGRSKHGRGGGNVRGNKNGAGPQGGVVKLQGTARKAARKEARAKKGQQLLVHQQQRHQDSRLTSQQNRQKHPSQQQQPAQQQRQQQQAHHHPAGAASSAQGLKRKSSADSAAASALANGSGQPRKLSSAQRIAQLVVSKPSATAAGSSRSKGKDQQQLKGSSRGRGSDREQLNSGRGARPTAVGGSGGSGGSSKKTKFEELLGDDVGGVGANSRQAFLRELEYQRSLEKRLGKSKRDGADGLDTLLGGITAGTGALLPAYLKDLDPDAADPVEGRLQRNSNSQKLDSKQRAAVAASGGGGRNGQQIREHAKPASTTYLPGADVDSEEDDGGLFDGLRGSSSDEDGSSGDLDEFESGSESGSDQEDGSEDGEDRADLDDGEASFSGSEGEGEEEEGEGEEEDGGFSDDQDAANMDLGEGSDLDPALDLDSELSGEDADGSENSGLGEGQRNRDSGGDGSGSSDYGDDDTSSAGEDSEVEAALNGEAKQDPPGAAAGAKRRRLEGSRSAAVDAGGSNGSGSGVQSGAPVAAAARYVPPAVRARMAAEAAAAAVTDSAPAAPQRKTDIYGRDVVDPAGSANRLIQAAAAAPVTEERRRLERRLTGLLNRLAEANLQGIVKEVATLHASEGRRAVAEVVTQQILAAVADGPRASDQFAAVAAAFVAGFAAAVKGQDFAANFVSQLATGVEAASGGKDSLSQRNLLLLLAHLYLVGLLGAGTCYSLLQHLRDGFREQDVDGMLMLLNAAGLRLRGEDPAAMKDFVLSVHAAAASAGAQGRLSKRAQLMLELVVDIKNNRAPKKHRRGGGGDGLDHATAAAGSSGIGGGGAAALSPPVLRWLKDSGVEEVKLPSLAWAKLTAQDKRGMWWLPTAEDSRNLPGSSAASAFDFRPDSSGTKSGVEDDARQQLLALAAAQRMNTDARRAVFCAIMGAEDCIEAHAALLRLPLKGEAEREIVRVLVECALHEAGYNPYYSHLALRLVKSSKSHRSSMQFCLWDKYREIGGGGSGLDSDPGLNLESGGMSVRELTQLARLNAALVVGYGLSLSSLKVVDFSDLGPRPLLFWRVFMQHLLSGCKDIEEVTGHFRRIQIQTITGGGSRSANDDEDGAATAKAAAVANNGLKSLVMGLRLFLRSGFGPWVADPRFGSVTGLNPSEVDNLLRRLRAAERALVAPAAV